MDKKAKRLSKKKMIMGVIVFFWVFLVIYLIILNVYKNRLYDEIKEFNASQKTNDDGVVVDMTDNPYFNKKQPGYKYSSPITITYYSDITKNNRHAMIFLPADYDENKEYPVLYLLHGLNGSHRSWKDKSAHIILQNMYYFDGVPEMIVVCPNSEVNEAEDTDDLDIYEKIEVYDLTRDDLVNNLMPYINEHYPVKNGPENTAIAGNSMGGRNTIYTAFSYPELFGYVGPFSSANVIPREGNNKIMHALLDDLTLDKDFKLLMLCVGRTDDVCGNVTYELHKKMMDNNINHIFYDTDGGHDDVVWQNALYNFAKKLFK